jgi:hypothetical protein
VSEKKTSEATIPYRGYHAQEGVLLIGGPDVSTGVDLSGSRCATLRQQFFTCWDCRLRTGGRASSLLLLRQRSSVNNRVTISRPVGPKPYPAFACSTLSSEVSPRLPGAGPSHSRRRLSAHPKQHPFGRPGSLAVGLGTNIILHRRCRNAGKLTNPQQLRWLRWANSHRQVTVDTCAFVPNSDSRSID